MEDHRSVKSWVSIIFTPFLQKLQRIIFSMRSLSKRQSFIYSFSILHQINNSVCLKIVPFWIIVLLFYWKSLSSFALEGENRSLVPTLPSLKHLSLQNALHAFVFISRSTSKMPKIFHFLLIFFNVSNLWKRNVFIGFFPVSSNRQQTLAFFSELLWILAVAQYNFPAFVMRG